MTGHRFIETNGIRMHVAERGEGPLVVLLHGWPECWYSWRHQLPALAKAGFRAVAPDQRGYGQTDRPDRAESYTLFHLVGDIVGLMDALGEETVVVVGHDWGAPVAWNAALMRPDRVRAVVGLSVPFTPRGPVRPSEALSGVVGGRFFYQSYFEAEGVAEAELDRDVEASLRRVLYSLSGDVPLDRLWHPITQNATCLFDTTTDPSTLPMWLNEQDLLYYSGEYRRTGFRGSLNWYRNFDRNWEYMAPFAGAKIIQPALFIGGERDQALEIPGLQMALERMPEYVTDLRGSMVLDGCGHWVQQERPEAVNAALIEFLRRL